MRLVALAVLLAGCRDHRRPLARVDGGAAVVVVDGRSDLAVLPSVPEIEPNDSIKDAMPLDGETRVAGTLALGDSDSFSLHPATIANADAGGEQAIAFVTLTVADAPALLDLLDARGHSLVSRATEHGRATYSYLRLEQSTVVRVRRSSKSPAEPIQYTLAFSTATSDGTTELEPNDDPVRANALPEGGTITGRFDGNDDRDLFALPGVPDGSTWRVELAAVPEVAPELRLRAGTSTLSIAKTGKGGELRLRNLPGHASSPLVLQVRAIDGESDAPYALRIMSEPALDGSVEHEPNDDRARANLVKPGDVVQGFLWPNDADWFCAAGDTPIGARIDALADVDWKLELADVAGKTVAKVDAGKRGAEESADPSPLARCVKVTARARESAFDAPYRLTITAPL